MHVINTVCTRTLKEKEREKERRRRGARGLKGHLLRRQALVVWQQEVHERVDCAHNNYKATGGDRLLLQCRRHERLAANDREARERQAVARAPLGGGELVAAAERDLHERRAAAPRVVRLDDDRLLLELDQSREVMGHDRRALDDQRTVARAAEPVDVRRVVHVVRKRGVLFGTGSSHVQLHRCTWAFSFENLVGVDKLKNSCDRVSGKYLELEFLIFTKSNIFGIFEKN